MVESGFWPLVSPHCPQFPVVKVHFQLKPVNFQGLVKLIRRKCSSSRAKRIKIWSDQPWWHWCAQAWWHRSDRSCWRRSDWTWRSREEMHWWSEESRRYRALRGENKVVLSKKVVSEYVKNLPMRFSLFGGPTGGNCWLTRLTLGENWRSGLTGSDCLRFGLTGADVSRRYQTILDRIVHATNEILLLTKKPVTNKNWLKIN